MPLLVVWTDMAAMVGGMFSAYAELSIPFRRFLVQIPTAVPFGNFSLGVEKGAVFGVLIALISCHFGLRIKSDSESLGRETTNAVVSAITLVILADALFAIAFHKVRVV
jgi:phospholipid/cholesterol/gamma-HCH transport system permease protein